MDIIKEKLKLLPNAPGVYIMLDSDKKVIYVGKAKILKNRVRQYFMAGPKTDKVMALVLNIADFNYIITKSEIDALSLENNLIKKYKPKYNILLKDDKTYPYLKIDLKEKYPTFTITRKIKQDGAKYYGPFMGGINVKDVLEIVNLAFTLRPCAKKFTDKKAKECLNYHIGKCLAPCAHYISEEEYFKRVKSAIEFLNGDEDEVKKLLNDKMNKYAEAEDFEKAISFREKLKSLDKINLKRITAINKFMDADIIGYSENGIYSAINVLFTRKGRMVGAKNFALSFTVSDEAEAVAEFISRYYDKNKEIPKEIIVSNVGEDKDTLEQFLSELKGGAVSFITPKIGVKKELLTMAETNAKEFLEISIDRINHKNDMTSVACRRLQEILSLKHYPKRMECYDISNVSGVDKVGSMVVFDEGEPDKQSYRRFRIKTVEGANDFASLKEVLTRRLSKIGSDEEERFPKPDLIIIDGGKGQLSSVKEVFDELKVEDIDLISLAKREEEIFVTDSNEPVVLKKSDYVLRMLQRIRDEAHRFAITYFRSLHNKRNLSSVLNEIEGIGEKKRKLITSRFTDFESIKAATVEELKAIDGIGDKHALKIYEYFHKEEEK